MKINKLFLLAFLLFVLFSISAFLITSKTQNARRVSPSKPTIQSISQDQQVLSVSQESQGQVLVTRVVDGDTIEISGGQKVRYIGIDTPETVHPEKPIQCFGKEASQKNKELVEGKLVRLEKDVSETDKYGRLLRYVYLENDDPTQTIFINDYLVRQGYAHSSSYPPDIKYQTQFQQSEADARDNNRGLWSTCQQGTNQQASSPVQAQTGVGPNDCAIKGNISSSKEKIYHMPGQKYYQKTIISEAKGEKWFCTEDEAKQAGFRKSNI